MSATRRDHFPRTAPLAACLAMALGLALPLRTGATTVWSVNSCADDFSAGTLRQAVASAKDGDFVDLSGLRLTCSMITLAHGEIPVAVNNLKFEGDMSFPGWVTIDAANGSRVLHHTGSGYLDVNYLKLTGGKYTSTTGSAVGGCIASSGTVRLRWSTVSNCSVEVSGKAPSSAFIAGGAGIYAPAVSLYESQISGNTAIAANYNNFASGGGIKTSKFTSSYSTISGNVASGSNTATGAAGGVFAGIASIHHSTIDSNQASDRVGGVSLGHFSSDTELIETSTISGNSAKSVGGLEVFASSLHLYNSTIAFNTSTTRQGAYLQGNATIVSSIIAKNSSASTFQDLFVGSGFTFLGNSNLIMSSNTAPADTISADPQLAPLAYHGELRRTHALNPSSPAVDQGVATAAGGSTDERGLNRSVGLAPDIGAYERQNHDDEIFYSGFD
ncbi:choice-of-anchor Q domain-containing protein [Dokdonella soli]|uniref:Right-handed parallel beta-helix repeat-containing protein n=1 Tax=Dokdonella soli TaxID=529810 RepID=A0ABP3TPX4_9GAMM